jgi:hypothetical protein
MLHITTIMLLVLLGVTAFFAVGIGALAERRQAEKKQRKLEAQRVRQEKWQNRKDAVVGKFTRWRRG